MPFNFNANLLEYYENNVPASSQTAPIPAATYPPIGPPGAISSTNAFSDQYATGFQTGFTPGVPSNIVGLDAIGQIFSQPLLSPLGNVNYMTNTFSLGYTPSMTTTQIQGISGEPGGMSYTPPVNPPIPHSPIVEGKFFTPNGPINTLAENVQIPPNHLSQQSNLPAGEASEWKTSNSSSPFPSPKITPLTGQFKTLSVVDYFNNTGANGFTTGRQPLDASLFNGISGGPGSFIYDKPKTPFETLYAGFYGANDRYSDNPSRYAPDLAIDGKIPTRRKINLTHIAPDYTLKGLYEQYNHSFIKGKYPGYVKQYVFRGIQNEKPKIERYGEDGDSVIKSVAAEHAIRLETARDAGPFMRNRTFMGLLSLQSRFQISLGMIPHALRSPRGLGKRNLPIKKGMGILDAASAYAYILAGSIQRVPYSLTDYSMQHSIAAKYGLGNTTDVAIWKALAKIKALKLKQADDDLIPFYFTDPKAPAGKSSILQFNGTLKTFSHSATPQWASKKYFGRPDQVHTYTGFDQNLGFSFEVYAYSKTEMTDMYDNLNELHGMLKPRWDDNKSFMTGPIALLTIGDYIVDQPGFLKSATFTPNEQMYWDLGKHPIRGLPQALQLLPSGVTDQISSIGLNGKPFAGDFETAKVPRAYQVSIQYQFIEKEMPDRDGTPFWDYKSKNASQGWKNLAKYTGAPTDANPAGGAGMQKYGKYLLYKGGL